jgi:hypothetical protein
MSSTQKTAVTTLAIAHDLRLARPTFAISLPTVPKNDSASEQQIEGSRTIVKGYVRIVTEIGTTMNP